MSKGEGLRFNEGKLRYDLIHPVSERGLVSVLTKGSIKYSERNWEKGMAWTKVIASLKRHLALIEAGEDYDLETGELHADHIQCNAHFLSAYYKIYPQGDDRSHRYLSGAKYGLDVDEVLCDFITGWHKKWGANPSPQWWNYHRGMSGYFEQMKNDGSLDEFYLSLLPKIKPSEIPFEPTCYVTSRPVDTSVTERWLEAHGFPAVKVYTVPVGASKVDIIKPAGVTIFVDDRYDNFVELNKAGICCFLIDAPHNSRYNVGFKRIKSLAELTY